jgi:hypothetical protein
MNAFVYNFFEVKANQSPSPPLEVSMYWAAFDTSCKPGGGNIVDDISEPAFTTCLILRVFTIALPSKLEVACPAPFSCFRVQENAQLCLLLAQDYAQRRGKKGALLLKRVSWTTLTLHLPRVFPPRTHTLL